MYLVDYGLAYRYCPEGTHKEYKEDPKRCHDGTVEFTSIDAHNGVGTSEAPELELQHQCFLLNPCAAFHAAPVDKQTDQN